MLLINKLSATNRLIFFESILEFKILKNRIAYQFFLQIKQHYNTLLLTGYTLTTHNV